jgi:hypothetical protein
MGGESGQATVEWTGVVLAVALALGALVSVAPQVDGRSLGGFVAHRLVCAVKGGCRDGHAALTRAYGERDARLVRAHAPNITYEPGERQLPVDPRLCRARSCAEGSEDRDLDLHRTRSGERATVFTRVLRRSGGTYLQYWFYYPDSNSTWAGSDKIWERSRLLPLVGALVRGERGYPGFHHDDWEGLQLRIDADGRVWARASSHGHYQGCKQVSCRNRWISGTGWTRVSRGSHAGHIPVELERGGAPPRHSGASPPPPRLSPRYPGRHMRERTSTAEGLRLIPLETLDERSYTPIDPAVKPPWRKRVYHDPEDEGS